MKISNGVELVNYLEELTGLKHDFSKKFEDLLNETISAIGDANFEVANATAKFWGLVNERLQLNQSPLAEVYLWLANRKATLNFRDKKTFETFLNQYDLSSAQMFLSNKFSGLEIQRTDLEGMDFKSHAASKVLLAAEYEQPSKIRKLESRQVGSDISQSLAAYLLWACWNDDALYRHFSKTDLKASNYTDFIRKLNPDLFERNRSLVIRSVAPNSDTKSTTFPQAAWVNEQWEAIDNHGFLVFCVRVSKNKESRAWNWVESCKIYAERFNEVAIPNTFFRKKEIQSQSENHYGQSLDEANWDLASEGFTYKDTFVLKRDGESISSLVVIFQKNFREETLLNCPGCRSTDVQGNSYSTLGVKSWECNNLLCLDRSIYNRGRRFQFRSVLYQSALDNSNNEIPQEYISFLQKDVAEDKGTDYLVESLVRHYSMIGDAVSLVDFPPVELPNLGRKVTYELVKQDTESELLDLEFFKKIKRPNVSDQVPPLDLGLNQEVIQGNSSVVLAGIANNSVGRAITSPPYYNAREYATWPNLYCYLSDMLLVAKRVFDTLKPGGFYVYNIFDYFDNDRTIVFSDMGKRRINLASPTIALFKSIGFDFVACSVWDKGDIQGNRGFNGGNRTPFYQSPFNCWEHVIVFQKPGEIPVPKSWNHVMRIPPVIKIIKGENTFGHTAPYPEALVEPFLSELDDGEIVLDPFAGSSTTALAAIRHGYKALMIEMHEEYAKLSRSRIRKLREELKNRIF